ncbi:MAG: class I SAM-dependent methyltransferase [Microscillaceae bacterium]|nr:class I SAM-dependent methyltransferase [Microscillaceae bacterium]MDW8459780.1 hypothetical protein [Cytophagales bacterium]
MDFDFLTSEKVQNFILDNLHQEPTQLLLTKQPFSTQEMQMIVPQIVARQKLKSKCPTWFQQPYLLFSPLAAEQSSSELTAQYKAQLLKNCSTIADLTGGLGVDTFAFAQTAQNVWHIEPNEILQNMVKHNFNLLAQTNIQFANQTAQEFLSQTNIRLGAIFLDPSRRDEAKKQVYNLADYQPNIIELLPQIWQKTDIVLLKVSPMADIEHTARQLAQVSQVHILAIRNEVKEVLFLLEKNSNPLNYAIFTTNFKDNQTTEKFNFQITDEQQAKIKLAFPQENNYLFEPNTAILKAGAFKTFAQRFQLAKLHPHTHLYTSTNLPNDRTQIPARIFQIKHIVNYQPKNVKAVLPYLQANLTVRNFPETVAQIRKKLALKEGGKTYIFACTLLNEQKVLLVCEKV